MAIQTNQQSLYSVKSIVRTLLAFTLAAFLSAGAVAKPKKGEPLPPPPPAEEPKAPTEFATIEDLWKDPTFQKQFIGTYGVNADIEPRISVEDSAILERVLPLMATDRPKAKATLEKAMKEVTKTTKADPSPTLYMTLGNIHFSDGNLGEALQQYKTAVSKFPTFRRAWRNVGLIHAKDGKFDEAITAFTKMLELGGGDAYSYGLLGYAYASKQDYQAAEVALRNALLLQPKNTEWRLRLTDCVYKQRKYEDCASLLNMLLEKNPEKSAYWLLQAQCYIGMDKPMEAAQNLESLDQLGAAKPETLYMLGDIYMTEELPDLALRAYRRAVDLNPEQKTDAPLRRTDYLAARGASDQARELATHITKVLDKGLAESDRQKLLKLDARLSMAEGKSNEQTAAVLEEILKLDPLDGEALMLLGRFHEPKNAEKAMLYYERAANIEKFEANATLRHAQLLVKQKKYGDALPMLRRVQEIKPRDDIARYLEQVERAAQAERAAKGRA